MKSKPKSSVIADLALWGPDALFPKPSLAEAERYCKRLATGHYENFPVASILLPRSLHQHFYNVYAYCRWADDLGDETGNRDQSLDLLNWWKQQLERCYCGSAEHPVFVALQTTIERFQIPQEPFADLISAFKQDQSVLRYESMAQLEDYCRRSANPVGRIVLSLCERVTEQNLIYSDSICTGLQLANFWQDVARDFDIGRVYLPRDHRERFGYSDDDLQLRRTTPQFIELMTFEVAHARQLLQAGFPLVDRMSGRLQLEIELFIRGGLLILDAIEQIDYRVWEKRPVVSKSQLFNAAFRTAGRGLLRRLFR